MSTGFRGRLGGYILLESVVALTLLSAGTLAIQRGMREALVTEGLARDYTQARFLLEEVVAELELQPVLTETSTSGRFGEPFARFEWECAVTKVEIPLPPLPPDLPPDLAIEILEDFKLNAPHLAKIQATVSWKRRGRSFERSVETLWKPEKIFVPEEPEI